MMVTVSVITPSYNGARYVAQAIESVLAQTMPDWEMIIVDDGSTDDTRSIVAGYLDRAPDKIHYIYQENKGLSGARNMAIRHARGEYLALLDVDDVWLPGRLEEGLRPIERHPEVGITHADIELIDGEGRKLGVPWRDKRYLSGRIARYIYTRQAHLSCPTVLFRRACAEQVGLFDETRWAIGPSADRDMWLRIAEHNEVRYIDKVLAQYRRSPTSMSNDMGRMFIAQNIFLDKHLGKAGCTRWARRVALARIFKEQGDQLAQTGRVAEARAKYLRAWMQNPLAPIYFYLVLKSNI